MHEIVKHIPIVGDLIRRDRPTAMDQFASMKALVDLRSIPAGQAEWNPEAEQELVTLAKEVLGSPRRQRIAVWNTLVELKRSPIPHENAAARQLGSVLSRVSEQRGPGHLRKR